MPLDFKKNEKFEDLGSLNEFLSNYGNYQISIHNVESENILLIINSEQEIELQIYCSKNLSKLIKTEEDFYKDITNYRVLRITNDNGNKYIRVSQSVIINGDPSISVFDNIEKVKKLKGNLAITFNLKSMDL